MLAAVGIVAGILLGYAAGGSLIRIPELDTRLVVLLISLSMVQGLARGRAFGLSPTPVGLIIWALVSVAVCACIYWASTRDVVYPAMIRGLAMIMVGTFANITVVLLNQGMPVAGLWGVGRQVASSGGFYVHLNHGTVLAWLGDVLSLSLGGSVLLVSVGDVVLLVGTTVLLYQLMLSDATAHGG